MDTLNYDLFTDGACAIKTTRVGSWAYIIKDSKTYEEIARDCGRELGTTNNRMELTAVIEGLKTLPTNAEVVLYSDSEYVVNGLMKWRINWKKKLWKNVMNDDLWKTLDGLVNSLT